MSSPSSDLAAGSSDPALPGGPGGRPHHDMVNLVRQLARHPIRTNRRRSVQDHHLVALHRHRAGPAHLQDMHHGLLRSGIHPDPHVRERVRSYERADLAFDQPIDRAGGYEWLLPAPSALASQPPRRRYGSPGLHDAAVADPRLTGLTAALHARCRWTSPGDQRAGTPVPVIPSDVTAERGKQRDESA